MYQHKQDKERVERRELNFSTSAFLLQDNLVHTYINPHTTHSRVVHSPCSCYMSLTRARTTEMLAAVRETRHSVHHRTTAVGKSLAENNMYTYTYTYGSTV